MRGGDFPRGRQRPIDDPVRVQPKLRRELIVAERRALLQLRNEGRAKGDVVRKIQRDLDLDEARLRT